MISASNEAKFVQTTSQSANASLYLPMRESLDGIATFRLAPPALRPDRLGSSKAANLGDLRARRTRLFLK